MTPSTASCNFAPLSSFSARLLQIVVSLLALLVTHYTAMPVHAQVNCSFTNLNHVNCSTTGTSAPDQGKWAWNPGTFGGGITGDTHFWVAWKWTTRGRVTAFESSNPRYELEFYDPGDNCGCGQYKILRLRTARHLNSPPPNSMRATILKGDCGFFGTPSGDKSLMRLQFIGSTTWAELNTAFDVSVDADQLTSQTGEVNVSWQNDVPLFIDCEAWLGKVSHCANNTVKECSPNGICCSTSNFTNCNWEACP